MNLSELVRVPETPGHVSSTARTDKTRLVVFLTKRNSWDFPGGPVVENPPATAGNTGDVGSIPGSGRSPGEGNGNPLQYSCLGNVMDREAWQGSQGSQRVVSDSADTELTPLPRREQGVGRAVSSVPQ